MQLEFHQLDRRWEHLRVREPHRQRHLLASLAESGQQTPIVVVVSKDNSECCLVIDGHKRIAALQQLGRDTVEATVWPMSEAEALLLSRSLRFSPQESALEQGWLLSEMEHRFSYSLDELARRFDRSMSWVSRRLALVELLPEAVQQRVREGNLSAQIAMKYLVPVARVSADDCERMANAFVRHRCDIELDARRIVTHERALTPLHQRIMLAEHRPPRGSGVKRNDPHPEEQALIEAAPEITPYISALKQKGRKVVTLALRQLLRLLREYPRGPFLAAVAEAARYGLYDLDRLERMILRRVARDYFLIGEKAEVPIKGTRQEPEGND